LASGARLDVQELRAGYAEVPQDAGIWWPAGQLNACGCPGITSPCMATLIRIMDEWRMTELLWWWWWFTSEFRLPPWGLSKNVGCRWPASQFLNVHLHIYIFHKTYMRQKNPAHYTRNSYTVLGLYPMLILSDETIPCCDCDPKKWHGHHGHHGHGPDIPVTLW
jgi:hypothetical protein